MILCEKWIPTIYCAQSSSPGKWDFADNREKNQVEKVAQQLNISLTGMSLLLEFS